MKNNDTPYRELQKHLDRQPVGFPAAKTGADIRILKHIFSPEQAEVAACLDYRPQPIEKIYKKAQNLVSSQEELSLILDRIVKKGGIEAKMKGGRRCYCNTPLVVGMYEFQVDRLSPEFIEDFAAYSSDLKWGLEFLSTELPQMRTIPITRSIQIKNSVSTFDEIETLLKTSKGPFVICECICRKKVKMKGGSCKATDRKDTCLALGDFAKTASEIGIGKPVSSEEALRIIIENQKQGLVLQPSNTQSPEFICSCCGCCCSMLRMQKGLPKPVEFWVSNFNAVLNEGLCKGCGKCSKKCQVNAIQISEKAQKAMVDLDRCIGCGLCVPACAEDAIYLQKKSRKNIPPETREDLYEVIMAKKKGKIGKLKIAGKIIKDTITTKKTRLLKQGR